MIPIWLGITSGNRFIDYHCEFFKSGITAIIKHWLSNGCLETPEEINGILMSEYRGRKMEET